MFDAMNSASTSPTSDSKRHSDSNSINTMTTSVPQLLSTPGTHASRMESKEYMKLTPVHLQCLTSPLRRRDIEQASAKAEQADYNPNQVFHINDTYRENFNLISTQLEKLLEGLNVIYRKIGYSNAEIINKEKLIFNALSGSITNFFDHAESDMKTLNEENDIVQEILNRMLEIMQDSSGIDTIPDIYVRNAILTPSCKTVFQSPKKPLSILSKRKLLKTARGFVFKSYLPAFIKYMEISFRLQVLIEVLGEKLVNLPNGGEIYDGLPNLESLEKYRKDLESHQNDSDFVSSYFMTHKEELLYSNHFNDISIDKIQILEQTIQIYQEEYDLRISQLKSVSNTISQLTLELKTELDPQIQKLLSVFLNLDSNVMEPNTYTSVSKSTIESLQKVLQEQQTIYEKRKEIKDGLLVKCEYLWNRLKVPQAYIDNFLNHCEGHSIAVTRRIVRELEKLEDMKKKLMKTLIEEALQRIDELWSFLQYDNEEKSGFLYTIEPLRESNTTIEDDENLLDVCESEIKSLERKMSVYEPALQLVKEFESLRTDKLSLEESSKDSSRLLARNSHKILLQEEKTRKRVTRHFPRVIKDLKNALINIQTTFGKPLVINGQNMMEVITQAEAELISKYPKSRLNLGGTNVRRTNPPTKARSNNDNGRVGKKPIPDRGRRYIRAAETSTVRSRKQAPAAAATSARGASVTAATGATAAGATAAGATAAGATAPLASSQNPALMNQTPVTKIIGSLPTLNERTTSYVDSFQNKKYVRGFKAMTPTIQADSLLPPKLVTRVPCTRIPETSGLTRAQSGNLSSSPLFQPRHPTDLVRPATLVQMSPNKINQHRSLIPTLSKSSSVLTQEFMNSIEKENVVDSTPRLQQKNEFLNFSSPYREPDNSVYKISKSPDGKCTLKIRENSHLESGFEDTSILD